MRLLIEIMFGILLLNGLLVCFFKVFGEDDVSIFTHCLHASLKKILQSLLLIPTIISIANLLTDGIDISTTDFIRSCNI